LGRFLLAAAYLATTFIGGAGSALADGIAISPTNVAIDVAHRIATVTIANHDPVLYTFQITPYSWSQIDGQDKLTPTNELLVSPPIFTLISEGQQIVRFALRNPAPVANELTFRILLRTAPSDTAPPNSELQMRVGFSIPVFIASPQGGEPKLTCGYRDIGHDRVEFSIENSGTAHVHVVHVRLADARGTSVDAPVAQYVLAGATATIRLAASRPVMGETIDAKLTFDQGPPVDIVVHRDG
jgi:fimbrial chaperone protein